MINDPEREALVAKVDKLLDEARGLWGTVLMPCERDRWRSIIVDALQHERNEAKKECRELLGESSTYFNFYSTEKKEQ